MTIEKSDRMAQEIIKAGGEAISFPGDVTDPDFPEAIVKATIQYVYYYYMIAHVLTCYLIENGANWTF